MTVTVNAPPALNGETLRTELAAAGVDVGERDFTLVGDTLEFPTLADSQQTVVQDVVTAHTGTPPPRVVNEASLRKTLNDALATLDSKATFDGLTAAQKLELARQVLRSLARIGLARLDQA